MEQQQDQAAGYRDKNMQQYDPTLAAMQQYDPSWAAAYAGMPMGMMNMNYYWPTGCLPGQYPQQKHPSLTKPEHQSRCLSLLAVGNVVIVDFCKLQPEQHCSCRPQVLKDKSSGCIQHCWTVGNQTSMWSCVATSLFVTVGHVLLLTGC